MDTTFVFTRVPGKILLILVYIGVIFSDSDLSPWSRVLEWLVITVLLNFYPKIKTNVCLEVHFIYVVVSDGRQGCCMYVYVKELYF
jgi:hypothetical protein